MTNTNPALTGLSDAELLREVTRLAGREREATSQLIASLMELDSRKLYLSEGYPSLFSYCTQALHLSEHAAYGRIEAARAARRFPAVLSLLESGALTLTTVCLLARHLTTDNQAELLDSARGKGKREVEALVAQLRPQPPVPSNVRKLPTPKNVQLPPTPETRAAVAAEIPVPELRPRPTASIVRPLAPERYKVQFTISPEILDKLRRAQDLLRHAVPNGDVAQVFDRALTALLKDVERTKLAATTRPGRAGVATPGSRHIPAAVKREVWRRDGGRCAFAGSSQRCSESGFLEFHHVVPYGEGGEASVENIQLRCRAHNAYEAEQHFGPSQMLLIREVAPSFWSKLPTRAGPS